MKTYRSKIRDAEIGPDDKTKKSCHSSPSLSLKKPGTGHSTDGKARNYYRELFQRHVLVEAAQSHSQNKTE